MVIGRWLGRLILALALICAGMELVRSLAEGAWQPIALGQLWYDTHVASLNLIQAVTQRYLHPAIWDPTIVWLLQRPAWLVLLGPGLLLALAFRRRKPRRRPPMFADSA